MKNKTRHFLGIVLGLLVSAVIPFSYADERSEPEVFSRDSVPFGRSYGEWAAAWWQWALSIEASKHPLFNDTLDCKEGQSGPVVFLGGKFCSTSSPTPCQPTPPTTATRTCTVSASKALFFPIVNVECALVEAEKGFCGDPKPQTFVELRLFTETLIDSASGLTAKIDGRPIRNLQKAFHVQSPVFGFTLPDDNLLKAIGEDIKEGTYFPQAVDDGVYLMIEPLPVGNHVIRFKAGTPPFFDITYNLTVVQP